MKDFSIRKAGRKELYSISVMTRKFFPYTGFTMDKVIERMADRNIAYFVALMNGYTVGFVDIQFFPRKKQAKILGLAVLEEFRRKGIGEKLFNKALLECRKRNCGKILLLVSVDNEAARNLYSKLGFRTVGKLKRKLWDREVLVASKKI